MMENREPNWRNAELSEMFLCLMIYLQVVWALVGKYIFIVHLWTITVIVGFSSSPWSAVRYSNAFKRWKKKKSLAENKNLKR